MGGIAGRTFAGLTWTALAIDAQAAVELIALILLAKLLPPSSFGVFAIAFVLVGFPSIVSELRVGPAFVKRFELKVGQIHIRFVLSLLFKLAAVSIVWWVALLMAQYILQCDQRFLWLAAFDCSWALADWLRDQGARFSYVSKLDYLCVYLVSCWPVSPSSLASMSNRFPQPLGALLPLRQKRSSRE